jgi:F-type H+-transporting ATPase subunit a
LALQKTISSKEATVLDLNNPIQSADLFTFKLFGQTIPVSNSTVMMWIIMAVLIVLSLVFTRNLKTIPKGRQNVAEIVVETINKILKGNMGGHGRDFAPYFGTVLLFLIVSNMSGILDIIPTGEDLYRITGNRAFESFNFTFTPPTKDFNVTLAFAVMTVLLVLFAGIRYKGFAGWLKSFVKPTPIMLPFHILDYATRTLSLSLRLFGNILAGFIIMEMVYAGSVFLLPIMPIASGFFDLFDAGLQAYIFVFLSSIYVREAIE